MGGEDGRSSDDDPWSSDSEEDDSDQSGFVFPEDDDDEFVFPEETDEDFVFTEREDHNDASPPNRTSSDEDETPDGGPTHPVDPEPDETSATEHTSFPPDRPGDDSDGSRTESERPIPDSWGPNDETLPWRQDSPKYRRNDTDNTEPGPPYGTDSTVDGDSTTAIPNPKAETDPTPEDATATDPGPTATPDVDPVVTSETKSDGGTVTSEVESSVDDSLLPSGPTEDQEMPLSDHIEEMIRRVMIVVVIMSIVSVAVFPAAEFIINFIWDGILGAASSAGADIRPHVYHPLAPILARLKVSALAGFIVALPVFVYETYRFMRPGLYPKERRYYLAAIPTSLLLAALGVAFAFFVVLPIIFIFFLYYSQGVVGIAFGLTNTFGLMLLLMGFFALIFQIPLFIMLAVMMGVTSRAWLASRRLYFWGAFIGIAFLTNPDPTGMAPIIVAASMVVLFEGTLLLLKWTQRE